MKTNNPTPILGSRSPQPPASAISSSLGRWARLLTLSLGLLALPAGAATLIWNGGAGNGSWNNSANWFGAGIPANGDTLVFQGAVGLVNSNNIAGLTLSQIRFLAGGFDVKGNSFTLTDSIMATNTVGTNTIENSMVLTTADVTVNVTAGLRLLGNLSGSVGVIKTGTGMLSYLGSSNPYTGTTTVNGGILVLNCGAVDAAFGGPLVINAATVKLGTLDREIPNGQPITINSGGLLDLNNLDDDVSGSLTLNGGTINVGTAPLTLAAPSTITVNSSSTINGTGSVQLGAGPCGINVVNGNFNVNPSVQGAAAITKTGLGNLYFYGANTYTGLTTVSQGWLWARNSLALGSAASGTTVSSGATLVLQGGLNITNETLTLNGPGRPSWAALDSESFETNIWGGPIILNAESTVGMYGGGTIRIIGEISGPGGINEIAGGFLSLEGTSANTYAGATRVTGGTLLLGKSPFSSAVPGPLAIGSGRTVRLLNNWQIYDPTVSVSMTNSSLLDLAGFNEWLGPINMQGAQITSGAGTLYLNGDITVYTNSLQSVISGNMEIYGGTYTLNSVNHYYSPDLLISANVNSGGGGGQGLIKTGEGEVSLAGNNSFIGPVTINGGTVWAQTATALGNTNTTATVNDGGTLFLNGAGLNFGLKPLVLNGPGSIWGALICQGTCTWGGAVTLASTSTIYPYAGASLNLTGLIGGPGGFTKDGPGTLTLSGAGENSFTGPTVVNAGLLQLNQSSGHSISGSSALIIGDGLGGADADVVRYINANGNQVLAGIPITISRSGLLDLNGHSDDIGPITFDGGGDATTGAGLLQLSSGGINVINPTTTPTISGKLQMFGGPITVDHGTASYDLQVSASISDSGASGFQVTKGSGAGAFVRLTGSNSFTGPLTINGLTVTAETPWTLGTTNGSTTVTSGGELFMYLTAITNEPLTLDSGTKFTAQGSCSWVGPVALTGNATMNNFASSGLFDIVGPISGTGNLTSVGTTNRLSGITANTYAGTTIVSSGHLVLNKSGSLAAVPGNLVVNNGAATHLAASQQTANTADILVNSGGLLDFGAFYSYADTLRGSGTVNFGVGGWIELGFNDGSSVFNGVMTGTGYTFGGYTLAKRGSGTFTVNGNNTFTAGASRVFAGKLIVNGSQPQVPAIVDAGATLGGSGAVGTILANGSIAPGNSPGMLNSSNVTFSASGKFLVELTGPSPGADYDQLNVQGTNNLASALLGMSLAFTTPVALGQKFTIINNDGAEPITGTFAGYPEGATFSSGGYAVQISYVGGTGNDVVLTLTAIPGALAGSAVTSGNGSHGIDPNGCNNLNLIITNTSGSAMTGVKATLSTTTPGVLITQPYSSYPNIAGSGMGTNVAPFQVSTLPSFACGTPIALQLSVDSSLGSFTMNFTQASGEPGTPVRFDNNIITNVPDIGTIESTNNVASWAGGAISKVAVSLWLVAPFSADMTLSLVAPDGTTVPLAASVGAGANFGTGSADASRTTFDDAAVTGIAAGASPFVGTFRPQGSLASFIGTTPTGDWRLRIQDGFGSGSPDTLRAWSLFLSGTGCATGSGSCDYCLTSLTGSIDTNTDLIQTGRQNRFGVVSSCGAPRAWQGTIDLSLRHYDIYSFTNTTGADACVTVVLTGNGVMAGVYTNAFDPSNISSNYVSDPGSSASGGSVSCSASIPAGRKFFVTVNEVTPNSGSGPYTVQLSGLPCPPPTLAIQPVSASQARISWPTWAGGYKLEATPSLFPTNFAFVPNEPIVTALKYNVTNSTSLPTNRFYRLNKP